MNINAFVNITSKAWSIPILASLHAGVPGRQASLISRTGAGRGAFRQSLEHLIASGLIERNPGHGHPLRPEFRLTEKGIPAAQIAYEVQAISPGTDHPLLRKSWTLPVLTTLHRPRYFGEIRNELQTITDRALSQSLKALETRGWVSRNVEERARPPRSLYVAEELGLQIGTMTAEKIAFA